MKKYISVYKKIQYGRTAKNWDKLYQKAYGDLAKYKSRLFIEDKSTTIVIREILKIFQKNRRGNFLDIGCGLGTLCNILANFSNNIYGCDISPYIILHNKKKNKKVKYFVDDVSCSKIKKKFKITNMNGLLYSLDDKTETHKKIIQLVNRVTKKNGYFIFSHRCNLSLINFLDIKLYKKNDIKKKKLQYHLTYFSDSYIKDLLESNNFKIKKTFKIDYTYNIYNTFLNKICLKNYTKFKNYKNYQKFYSISDFEFYSNLNFIGRIIYIFSKVFYNNLLSRSSVFICKKR